MVAKIDTEQCQRCGAPLRLEDLYCANCGAPVPEHAAAGRSRTGYEDDGPRRRRAAPWAERTDPGHAPDPSWYASGPGSDPTWWEQPLSQRPRRSPAPQPAFAHSGASRWWAAAAPLGIIAGAIFSAGILSFVIPLLVWQIQRGKDDFAATYGRETFNALLSLVCYVIVAAITAVPLAILTLGIWVPIILVVGIGGVLVFGASLIVAAVRALNEQPFRYPLTIRFFR